MNRKELVQKLIIVNLTIVILLINSSPAHPYVSEWTYQGASTSQGNRLYSSADGSKIAVGCSDCAYLLDQTGNLLWTYKTALPVVDISMTMKMDRMTVATSGGYFQGGKLYYFPHCQSPPSSSVDVENGVSAICYSPEGNYLAITVTSSLGWNDEFGFYGCREKRYLWSGNFGIDGTTDVALSSNGGYFTIAGTPTSSLFGNGGISVYDRSGNLIWNVGLDSSIVGSKHSLGLSADGKYIAVGNRGNENLYLLDRDKRPFLKVWIYKTGPINGVAISSDGQRVMGGTSNKAYLFDQEGNILWTQDIDGIEDVAMTDNASHLFVLTKSNKVYAFRGESTFVNFALFNTSPRVSQPIPVSAVCADGSESTLVEVSSPTSLSSASLEIIGSGSAGEDGDIRVIERESNKIRAKYTSPENFCRSEHTEDAGQRSRTITVKVVSQDKELCRFQFSLYRAPVVLLHGLWGDPEGTWKDVVTTLTQNLYTPDILYAHNFHLDSANSLLSNKDQCDLAIGRGITRAGLLGYSAGKVDVLAYSMGGILPRIYLQDLGSHDYRGDIHKLITIGAPHSGSHVANFVMGNTPLQIILSLLDRPTNLGGMSDLCVDSWAIDKWLNRTLPDKHAVPSHSIVGVATLSDKTDWELDLYVIAAKILGAENLLQKIFGEDNDLVVSINSQIGGLPTSSKSSYDGLSHSMETESSRVEKRLLDLLNYNVQDPAFAKTGFNPPNLSYPPMLKTGIEVKMSTSSTSGTTQITSPLTGSSVKNGSTYTIKVSTNGSTDVVMLVVQSGVQTKTTKPFNFSVTIPQESLGAYPIVAIGFAGNEVTAIDSIELQVGTSASITGLECNPSLLISLPIGATTAFQVIGSFSDGVEHDITALSSTVYALSDPKIAEITADGVIHGKQVGETVLNISSGSYITSLIVDVVQNGPQNSVSDWSLYR